MEIKELREEFIKLYGMGEIRTFHSPGRVNLIGEHIDYNGGYVLPCALDFGTYGCVRERKDRKINFASTNFPLKVQIDVDNIKFSKEDDWANYPKGVIVEMMKKGYSISGMDILVSGNIPNGAGLSSSASLEVLMAVIIDNLFNGGKLDRVELVQLCQKAENNFVGVNCGIMDQFAIGMGKKNKAILLDCNTLKYSYCNVDLKDNCIVVLNTNKRRSLNESKYNERRAECEEALKILQTWKKINALCELTVDEFNNMEHLIEKENVRKRAKHAVYENERTKDAYRYLNEGDIEKFGQLLTKSHDSLRDLYEVSGKELDTIVSESLKVKGCLGARMTGAGFGGCALAIVKNTEVDNFMNIVRENYKNIIGYEPSFYLSGIGEGTGEI
ncbi:galactokinase [Clostridium sp. JN-9]|uniref:galactokinase n=1 Tax=Clostridium sp. JN-9 TaxID=2507159 RepID=UPI000FFE14EF|nr:galactokinase [Clostridium sp. JN-9]QAT39611.1 galactokinase [Clostridium sp. JN-9]